MRYRYHLCDVFTDTRFGGNQLAVLPEARGLADRQMQQIAREFNLPETTFVFPPTQKQQHRTVRIFTPTAEVPFAGHPSIGTAFVLAATGELGPIASTATVTFAEKAGLVAVSIRKRAGEDLWCELSAPARLTIGQPVATESLVAVLSLEPDDIVAHTHPPQIASVGLGFLFTELRDRAALERARPNAGEFEALAAEGLPPAVFAYVRSDDEFDVRGRMFAPLHGIPEDPATGSASCALGGLLCHYNESTHGAFRWRMAQGVEMGRPSVLEVRAEKRDGVTVATWVGGSSVMVGDGFIEAG